MRAAYLLLHALLQKNIAVSVLFYFTAYPHSSFEKNRS